MDRFLGALVSREKNRLIPDACDYWGELIGSWDLDYVEGMGTKGEKRLKGEWHFVRILEGMGIADVFICPARAAGRKRGQGECGVTVRMFNPSAGEWDVIYTCAGSMTRFAGTKEEGRVVLTNLQNKRNRWVFTDISADSFHWQNETDLKEGGVRIGCRVSARRLKEAACGGFIMRTREILI